MPIAGKRKQPTNKISFSLSTQKRLLLFGRGTGNERKIEINEQYISFHWMDKWHGKYFNPHIKDIFFESLVVTFYVMCLKYNFMAKDTN